MSDYSVYEVSTGRIVMTGRSLTLPIAALPLAAGQAVLPGRWPADTYYIRGGLAVFRPENPATIDKCTLTADLIDAVTITAIPAASEVMISGAGINSRRYRIDDGLLVYQTASPGPKRLRIISFPYLDQEFEVDVHP